MRRRLDRFVLRGLIALTIGLGVTALAPLLHQVDHHDDHEHVGAAIVYHTGGHEHPHPHPHPHEPAPAAPDHGADSPLHGALLLGDAVDRTPRFALVETAIVLGAFETQRAPFAARIAHRLRGPPRS
jgi:hypothetical protein